MTAEVAAIAVASASTGRRAKVSGGLAEGGLKVGLGVWMRVFGKRQDRLFANWAKNYMQAPALFVYRYA